MTEKEDYVYMAKLCEQAERYDEMVQYMTKVVEIQQDGELSVEERNLLSVAYKNVIGARRSSWRIISSIEQKEEGKASEEKLALIRKYKTMIEEELDKICAEVIKQLEDLISSYAGLDDKQHVEEAKVFYYKMQGDYHRYTAEYATGQDRKNRSENSLKSYSSAQQIAKGLPSTHPIRLGLALNFSVFHYEIMNDPNTACKLAKQAFDDAIADLESPGDENYKDATLIMQLLRDNLTLWSSDMQDQDQESEQVENIEDEK